VQVGANRAQALEGLGLKVLDFLELGGAQALEVQVQVKDRGLELGVKFAVKGVVGLADFALKVNSSSCGSGAEAEGAG
jgi:hypothetical protein